jgi:hypothetical protein
MRKFICLLAVLLCLTVFTSSSFAAEQPRVLTTIASLYSGEVRGADFDSAVSAVVNTAIKEAQDLKDQGIETKLDGVFYNDDRQIVFVVIFYK